MHGREILALSASLLGYFSYWTGLSTGAGEIGNDRQQPVLTGGRVIDDEVDTFVKSVMDEWGIHGMSMVIIRPGSIETKTAGLGGDMEYGSWGLSTEDRANVTPEVLSKCRSSHMCGYD